MFNKTLNLIASRVKKNLFNPDQAGSPQPWHVPEENVYSIIQTPDLARIPRVVFSLGALEADLRDRMEAFSVQPEYRLVREKIHPGDHDFSLTYTLQEKPVPPVIRVRAVKSDGTKIILWEGDDFVIDYETGTIAFREGVNDIDFFRVVYQTDTVVGSATAVHLIQQFSIETVGEDAMKAEAICSITIGLVEAFKEDILSKRDTSYEGLNIITDLNPIDIQLVNREQQDNRSGGASITLNYRMPGTMHIRRKTSDEELGIIEKIYHPDVTTSEEDVDIRIDTLETGV